MDQAYIDKMNKKMNDLRERLRFRIRELGYKDGFLEDDVINIVKFLAQGNSIDHSTALLTLIAMPKSELKSTYKKLIKQDTDIQKKLRTEYVIEGKEAARLLYQDPLKGE
jgi:NCAIR mutase (PurE)-related protein